MAYETPSSERLPVTLAEDRYSLWFPADISANDYFLEALLPPNRASTGQLGLKTFTCPYIYSFAAMYTPQIR
jgi:hypothetical protein